MINTSHSHASLIIQTSKQNNYATLCRKILRVCRRSHGICGAGDFGNLTYLILTSCINNFLMILLSRSQNLRVGTFFIIFKDETFKTILSTISHDGISCESSMSRLSSQEAFRLEKLADYPSTKRLRGRAL